ncbi:MAG TPA: hypothetical protein VLH14_02310 [Patescibacteria group bacterium]|nr:hypothetical protein [Patescibacteria group bacterium]
MQDSRRRAGSVLVSLVTTATLLLMGVSSSSAVSPTPTSGERVSASNAAHRNFRCGSGMTPTLAEIQRYGGRARVTLAELQRYGALRA